MAKLILSRDGLVLKEIPLLGARTRIGRRPHNDLQIDHPAVSGEHAALVIQGGECWIEDLGSTNGTRVNGQPIGKVRLQDADVIEVGKYQLTFHGTPVSRVASFVPGSAGQPPLGQVRVLDGPSAGKELELVKAQTTLGKPGVQVAVIERQAGGYFLRHGEGGRFPLVNGQALDDQPYPLEDQDLIVIAGVKMQFLLKAPGP